MTTPIRFQHMKITPLMLLAQETMVNKTYYMLKMLENIVNERPIQIITRSPNQYPNYKTSNEIKSKDKYKISVVMFDDMLRARNGSRIDEFYTRGRHGNLSISYIGQS